VNYLLNKQKHKKSGLDCEILKFVGWVFPENLYVLDLRVKGALVQKVKEVVDLLFISLNNDLEAAAFQVLDITLVAKGFCIVAGI
jgi:hypothetical protein